LTLCWLSCLLRLLAHLAGWPYLRSGSGRTDLNLDSSDLRLNLSPDVLELATSLAASVAQPLMQVCWKHL
jgi:hypothetical protein